MPRLLDITEVFPCLLHPERHVTTTAPLAVKPTSQTEGIPQPADDKSVARAPVVIMVIDWTITRERPSLQSNNTKKNIVIPLIKGNAKPPDPIGVCIILVTMDTLPRKVLLQISKTRLISTWRSRQKLTYN